MRILPFVALVLLPAVASAQATPTRQGFGISFGIGSGSAAQTCDGCTSDSESGLSGYLRLGGHLNQNFFVGAESNGWTKSKDGVDTRVGHFSGVVQWYPSATMGWYTKGGLGVSTFSSTDGTDELTSAAGSISLGGGYDWRVKKNFSLTPYLNYLHSAETEMELNGTKTGLKAGMNVFQIGLGFTWH